MLMIADLLVGSFVPQFLTIHMICKGLNRDFGEFENIKKSGSC